MGSLPFYIVVCIYLLFFESPVHNQIPKNMKQVLDIAAQCSTRHGHTHIGILLRYNCYTIFREDIRVPVIMLEDLELTISKKSEKLDAIPPFFDIHPYSALGLFSENSCYMYRVVKKAQSCNSALPSY